MLGNTPNARNRSSNIVLHVIDEVSFELICFFCILLCFSQIFLYEFIFGDIGRNASKTNVLTLLIKNCKAFIFNPSNFSIWSHDTIPLKKFLAGCGLWIALANIFLQSFKVLWKECFYPLFWMLIKTFT